MKIGKRTISFTGSQEINDLKVALMFAGTSSIMYLRRTAANPIGCLNNHLVENKGSTEEAIVDMLATACQFRRILGFSANLATLNKRDIVLAKKDFTTISRFCKNEISRLNEKS